MAWAIRFPNAKGGVVANNLVLAGFMGAGKTTVGREAAKLLGWEFVDLDELVASGAQMTVAEIFESHGEAEFRRLESIALADLAAHRHLVLAIGGGALILESNRDQLYRLGTVVFLQAPPETLWTRASKRYRPLARDKADFMALIEKRSALYCQIPYQISAHRRSAIEVAEELVEKFSANAARIHVRLAGRSYDVVIRPGGLSDLGNEMGQVSQPGPCIVVSNKEVWRRYGPIVRAALRSEGYLPAVHLVPPGEVYKSWRQAQKLYEACAQARLDRSSPLIALGGGVVGDLGGFVASTYLRGLPFIQVPTTLLAQIDSAVGGKVAINLPAGKNLVGSFYQPALALADPLTLHSLPTREYRAGLAELIKYGVILDEELFGSLENCLDAVLTRSPRVLVGLIRRACELKARVVESDEREVGQRQILNFGHTLGHAIERVAGYGKVLHGEAVGIGMVLAARLGNLMGTCQPTVGDRLERLLVRVGLPTRTDLPPNSLIETMQLDKKATGGTLTWVLPRQVGVVELSRQVPIELVAKCLTWAQH